MFRQGDCMVVTLPHDGEPNDHSVDAVVEYVWSPDVEGHEWLSVKLSIPRT